MTVDSWVRASALLSTSQIRNSGGLTTSSCCSVSVGPAVKTMQARTHFYQPPHTHTSPDRRLRREHRVQAAEEGVEAAGSASHAKPYISTV